jgi:DNA (cytosine-5)-methyltransferase 1
MRIQAAPRFIDLFCGIGGMRLGFEAAGGRCVFSADWDRHAQKTYAANFGEAPVGDLRGYPSTQIPDHDILVAGFPCQPFSISGVVKKASLGKPHGFRDKTQGTLFFEVARIINDRKPSAFVLENVKNLLGHDRGKTFRTIYDTLADDLGYDVHFKVLDAKPYVPQNRERIFIVGFREPKPFNFPAPPPKPWPKFRDILIRPSPKKYVLTDHLWDYLQRYAEKHRAAGNGFGFGLTDLDGYSRTLSARYYKDGSEILVPRRSGNPRRLTPRECARLMGFPGDFQIPVSDTQAYRQFGNSVVVPLVGALAANVITALRSSEAACPQPRQLRLVAG